MKNLKYFPFERNKYYYGKLLTERDFTEEQRYLNDKRRLCNRFLAGVGVAAGLNVVQVDEKSISVEAGIALDFSGRELVVDTPVMCRLSTIEGFEAAVGQGKKGYVYLCIEYDEKETSPAHNVVESAQGSREEFDKYQEGYRLYLTEQEPASLAMTAEDLLNRSIVLYRDDQLCLMETLPRRIKGGETFAVKVTLENTGHGSRVSGRLSQELDCVSYRGENRLELQWNDLLLERGQKDEQIFYLEARDLKEGEAVFSVAPQDLNLSAGGGQLKQEKENTVRIPITGEEESAALVRQYYRDAMENAVRNNYPQGIYLAKIYLICTKDTYMIQRVEDMPFEEYVYNGHLMMGLVQVLEREVKQLKEQRRSFTEISPPEKEDRQERPTVARGTVEIDLGIGGKRGQRFFSHEIFHGLGLGNVKIDLSLMDDERIYSGSAEIFEEMDPKAELAARLDASRGCFTVGLRLTEPTSRQKAVVFWRAEWSGEAMNQEYREKRLYIRPAHLELKVRESAWLEAVCENIYGMTVTWTVKTQDGGTVTGDGLYTAPNSPGVYEVRAWCQEAPELGSSIFIIVRE